MFVIHICISWRHAGESRSGHVKLCVISIAAKMNSVVPEDVAKREEVNTKQEWPRLILGISV